MSGLFLGRICKVAALSFVLAASAQAKPSINETRAIAREAYLYGFPMVESYKTLYAQAVQSGGPDFKAPFNQIGNAAKVFTPDDKAIVTPNSDTPYSFLWMDLRAGPLVLSLPKTDPKRYLSVQLIDLYTFNFDYLGTRNTGSDGGDFLVVGPGWKGSVPPGIKKVVHSETQLAYALYRTQLFGPDDLSSVQAIQAGYKVQPLSAYLGKPAPHAAQAIQFPPYDADAAHGLGFFSYLNFLLQFAPVNPSEVALRKRFAQIGIVPGKPFDAGKLPQAEQQALLDGIHDADTQFQQFKKEKVDTKKVNSGQFFGTRSAMQNNYLFRYAGARMGIFGNSKEEALYTGYFVDADGAPCNGATHDYVLHFAKGQLPPAKAFWSITMYDGKTQLLVANPLNRYLINSPMLPDLKLDADGGLTLYLQHASPGKDKEANWLPAPDGPFFGVLRLYLPDDAALNGTWQAPKAQKTR